MHTIISILFIAVAAAAKALVDTLTHHYSTSIFKNKNALWWDPRVSWQHVNFFRFTKYRPDAWHLANSVMICGFIAAWAFHSPFIPWWLEIPIGGIEFILVFNLFYNKILRRK